jgi:hypothetical protein
MMTPYQAVVGLAPGISPGAVVVGDTLTEAFADDCLGSLFLTMGSKDTLAAKAHFGDFNPALSEFCPLHDGIVHGDLPLKGPIWKKEIDELTIVVFL